MSQTFFITSSGTDIGKTHAAAILTRQLLHKGKSVRCLKPIMSGYDQSAQSLSDAGVLLDAMGLKVNDQTVEDISPWRFTPPVSPDVAARRAGVTIELEALTGFCRKTMQGPHDITLVEAAGGIMAPLNDEALMLDWLAALACPAILVVGSYLGSISHTLTAVSVIKARGLDVAAIIISCSEESSLPKGELVAIIKRHAPGIPVRFLDRLDMKDWQRAGDLTF